MALEEYRRKRRFDETPEPAGGETDQVAVGRYVVQKHAARRLHYDLRLEIDGVLRSWAVPKGPSLNPDDKRLAARTEDHPLEYLTFEKVIPAGNYGAGAMIIWDAGTFECEGEATPREQLERGELKLVFHGKRLAGGFVLVKTRGPADKKSKGDDWLLIKHRDAAADPDWDIEEHVASVATGRTLEELRDGLPPDQAGGGDAATLEGAVPGELPADLAPMLASSADQPSSDPDWLFELKWDGVRIQARIDGDRVRLISRNGNDVTSHYPELSGLPRAVRGSTAVLDGEIVVLDQQGRADFGRLQSRMHAAEPSYALLQQDPVVFYIFDLLGVDGYDLRRVPLEQRKEYLKEILSAGGPLRYSDHVVEKGEDLFALAQEHGAEGIVAKARDGAYVSGRSRDWVKIKVVREVDAVIGGFTEPKGGRSHLGAILVGLHGSEGLRFVGGVGTGFDSSTLDMLAARLSPLKTQECPFVVEPQYKEKAYWVEPKLVARIKFGAWTNDGVLRHPVYQGLRADLAAEECVDPTEQPTGPTTSYAPRDSLPTLREPDEIEAELFNGTSESVRLELDGKSVRLTHLNKIYFPGPGYTKRHVLAYYYRVAEFMLPFLRQRPLVLHRFPNGIDAGSFYQKDCGEGVPDWMDLHVIPSEGRNRDTRYFVANDLAALLYLTNLGSIEHHPWPSRIDALEYPDYVFFDLDPTPETPYSTVVKVAREILKALDEMGLSASLKTSGSKGMHLWLPLEREYTFEQTRSFAEIVARVIHARLPRETTLERMTEKRPPNCISLDYSQNAFGRPLATVYCVRPRELATVAAPIGRAELRKGLEIENFTIATMPARLKRKGDLWSEFWDSRQRIEPALENLQRATATESRE